MSPSSPITVILPERIATAETRRFPGSPVARPFAAARPNTATTGPWTTAPARDPLEPTATRNCPHCQQPITIVALLATPEAARPTMPRLRTDVVPLRRTP
jgi:hypothetical protein